MTAPFDPTQPETMPMERVGAGETEPRAARDGLGTGTGTGAAVGEPMRTEHTSGLVRASGAMAVGTLVSRITGFLAKVVLLAFYGAWVVSDSYALANTLPNIIFELLVGGVLTSVAVPLLSRARHDADGGEAYTQRLMTMAVVALAIATAAAVAAAPLLIQLYQGDDDHGDLAMATHFAYLLLPQIFFYGLAALFQAILNTNERFAAPAWAPAINNLVVIGIGIALLTMPGGVTDPTHGMAELSRTQFLLLGIGTTGGIVLQAAVLLPSLRRSGFRFRWRWGIDARMVSAGRLMAWVIAYALISQIGYITIVRVAHASRDGLYTLYWFGSMLFQLPYGILGVSLLTAIMPRMSRHAAAGDVPAVKDDMSVANRLSTVALLPVTAAMVALAVPLATVTARYGAVSVGEVRILAFTLAAFAIGLLPLAITLVQLRVFYAMADGRTPAIINGIMVAVRVPLLLACLALPENWVVPGLAAAMSVSYVVGVVVGEMWLHARFGHMGFGTTLSTIARTAAASAAGGVAAWWAAIVLLPVDATSFGGAVASLVVGSLVGLVVVVAALLLLRVQDVDLVRQRLAGKLGGSFGGRGGATPRSGAQPGSDRSGTDATAPGRHHRGRSRQVDVEELAARPAATGQPPSTTSYPQSQPQSQQRRKQGQEPVTEPHDTSDPTGHGGHTAGGAPLAAGTVVGERYRLITCLATDAARTQYWKARDTVLPRDMAVTILPATDHTSAVVTRSLRVGRLGHPGLPQTLDMGEVGNDAYVAAQWVDGITITELLGSGPLETPVALTVAARIAETVRAVHDAGLALGAIHPSLVRVNVERQVRLSHVACRTGADQTADIRALGGLLYAMVTGNWPLDADDGPGKLPPAGYRRGRATPATTVNAAVPHEVSTLIERALHPDHAHGIGDVPTLLTELRAAGAEVGDPALDEPDGGESGESGAAGIGPPGRAGGTRRPRSGHGPRGRRRTTGGARTPAPALNPRERTIRTERRIKLSIAGAMLTALAVLIVITFATLFKQQMARMVAPINAANHQELVSGEAPTTTRTVGTTEVGGSAGSGAGSSPGSGGAPQSGTGSSTSPSPTEEAKPIPVADATVYDPQGDGNKDYTAYVDRAFDGDSSTFWLTWVYKQQFGPKGLKTGVGLMLQFDHAVTPSSVTVATSTPGTDVEIRSSDGKDPALDATKMLGKTSLSGDPVSIAVPDAPKSQYLLVWVTKLAKYTDGGGGFQSNITEISVTGTT